MSRSSTVCTSGGEGKMAGCCGSYVAGGELSGDLLCLVLPSGERDPDLTTADPPMIPGKSTDVSGDRIMAPRD